MAENIVAVREYLTPASQSFWRWSDDLEALEWATRETIVFRLELEMILVHLAPSGLPPLNALVLLLAACRDSWQASSSGLGTVAGLLSSVERRDLPDWLPKLFGLLDVVNALPHELRTKLRAKAVLAEIVFEDSHNRTSSVITRSILDILQSNRLDGVLFLRGDRSEIFLSLVGDLRSLYEGLERFDADALELRMKTGLDQLVEPAEIDVDPAQMACQLIAELQDDSNLSGVARLAKHLMATVSLPRPMVRSEQLPLGGVSDITNRGPLDRLLLSELAHDNLTLTVRLALNEALYLRRETPPDNPPPARAVLIDSGIRLWGVPRVFATAAAMAFAATNKRRADLRIYRACGKEVEPVDFTSRQGLVRHMEALEYDAHPGAALQSFFAAVDQQQDRTDAVLITGADVLDDQQFQQSLRAVDAPSLYLATVDRQGQFRLQLQTPHGRKVIREARLELDRLLAPAKKPKTPLIDRGQEDLPAIFSVEPFPLMLNYRCLDPERMWRVRGQGLLILTKDGRLMCWTRPKQGAKQLSQYMVPGVMHWSMPVARDGVSHAVIGRPQQGKLYLLTVDFSAGNCRTTRLDTGDEPVLAVSSVGPVVFAIRSNKVTVLEMASGRCVQDVKIPSGIVYNRDRFFRKEYDQWYALSYDGLSARFDEIPLGKAGISLQLQTLFQHFEHADIVGVTNAGDLYFFATDKIKRVPYHEKRLPYHESETVKVLDVSRDGGKILVDQGSHERYSWNLGYVVDVNTGRLGVAYRLWSIDPNTIGMMFTPPLRKHFVTIGVDDGGKLALVSRKNKRARFELRNREILLTPCQSEWQSSGPEPRPFRPTRGPECTGYSLQVAIWADGSRAFLDSRGLLHLKSSNKDIPEITLVLRDGQAAGWCSDGRLWGLPYHTGQTPGSDAAAIFEEIIEPFVRQLS